MNRANRANDIQTEEDLICEALVREIGRANRWSARVDAWEALLATRREGESLRQEQKEIKQEQKETYIKHSGCPKLI
jgi:hypothetical protein